MEMKFVCYDKQYVSWGQNVTYICPCINESSGTSDMVSKTGLMKGSHMVYSHNIHIVTLKTETNNHKYLMF